MEREELIAVVKGDVSDFEKKMDSAHSKMGEFGNKTLGLGKELGRLALAATAGYGAIEIGKKAIESVDFAEDKLEQTTAGLRQGFQYLSQSIFNSNFENLSENFLKAVNAGRELQEKLDELAFSTRSLDVVSSEYNANIQKNRLLASDFDADANDRLIHINAALADQEELNKLQIEHAEKAKSIAMERLKLESNLTEEQITGFLEQYNSVEDLRGAAIDYLKEYDSWVKIVGKDEANRREQMAANGGFGVYSQKTGAYSTYSVSPEVLSYANELRKSGNAAKTTWDEVARTMANLNNITAQGDMTLRGMQRQLKQITGLVKGEHGAEKNSSYLIPKEAFVTTNKYIDETKLKLYELNVSFEKISDSVSVKTTQVWSVLGIKLSEIKQVVVDMQKEMNNLATKAIINVSESIGNMISGGSGKDALDSFLMMIADWAMNLGELMVAAGIAASAFWKSLTAGPHGAAAAIGIGAALIIAAAAVKGAMKEPGTSGGSSYSGGSGGNSMNITELRDLRNLQVEVNGTLKASGRDLVVVLSNENKRTSL